jgi:hypothetical protein
MKLPRASLKLSTILKSCFVVQPKLPNVAINLPNTATKLSAAAAKSPFDVLGLYIYPKSSHRARDRTTCSSDARDRTMHADRAD